MATFLTSTRPFTLTLSCIYPGKPALPNQPVTKACTRFRSHPLDPRSQLNADRFPLKVTAMLYFDATTSEPASVIIAAATVLVAVWVRGWDHVGVSRPGT